jgi:uncharacterized lipoprotein YehR (DUF1307 family)
MNIRNRMAYLVVASVLCTGLTGCFSYHREVRETTTTPTASEPSGTTQSTTTTSGDDGTVEHRSTTTYSNP